MFSPQIGGVAHLERRGDTPIDQAAFGGEALRLEGFELHLNGLPGNLEYMGHIQDFGDTPWCSAGQFLGTRGQAKRLEGFAIRFREPTPYNICYSTNAEGMGNVSGRNGEFVGSRGASRKLHGLRVWLEPASGYPAQPFPQPYPVVQPYPTQPSYSPSQPFPPQPQPTYSPSQPFPSTPYPNQPYPVNVSPYPMQPNIAQPVFCHGVAHLSNYGDMNFNNSEFVGTRGQKRQLEGFTINVNGPPGLSVEYMAHVQDIGDTPWYPAGSYTGTRGQSKRVEGFAVRLVGPLAHLYNVHYMAHVQDIGDTSPTIGPNYVGTRGQSKRIEGFRVWITPR